MARGAKVHDLIFSGKISVLWVNKQSLLLEKWPLSEIKTSGDLTRIK